MDLLGEGNARFLGALAVCGSLLWAAIANPASALPPGERTQRVSASQTAGGGAGDSARPALSVDGRHLAFTSTAPDLAPDGNGAVRDVFLRDLATGTTTIVSEGPGGAPADGPSDTPALAGARVAFASAATNLVPDDANGSADIFVRDPGGVPFRVSIAFDGGEADGGSHSPDISADGRFVSFVSAAANLVPADRNGRSDVFVRDLVGGTIVRLDNPWGVENDGDALTAAISHDGRYVSFTSAASNLVAEDRNRVPDVFVADRELGTIERVSISTHEDEQDRSLGSGGPQQSDLSTQGRFVVFDSAARNLVRGDRNRRTDIFVRDRLLSKTRRVSVSSRGGEAAGSSVSPAITPDGRFVAFSSWADDIAAGDSPGPDVLVRDRRLGATSVVSVPADGSIHARETVAAALRRPALSADAALVAFTSSAPDLVPLDDNGRADVFLRDMAPPEATWSRRPARRTRARRPRFAVRTGDPAADVFLCRMDRRRFPCRSTGRLPALRPGRHELRVSAGGPGMLFQSPELSRRFRVLRRR